MVTSDPIPTHTPDFDKIRDNLLQATGNKVYQEYSNEGGPINLREVDPAAIDDNFGTVFQAYGWPDMSDSRSVERDTVTYSDNDNFLHNLRVYPESPDKVIQKRYLNNFNVWLRTKPVTNPNPVIDTYAAHPALHRAHAVVPDLMTSVQEFFDAAYSQSANSDELTEFLYLEENAVAIEAAHMTYRILKRLIKQDDRYRQFDILFGTRPKGHNLIGDAHDELAL